MLAPGKRTVSQALRVMGLAAKPGFARYHEVLSRARWDGRAVAHKLLAQVLDAFLPAGEVVIGIDDIIERRWGAKIKARGIYRDPALLAWPFRQGEWSALAVAHGHGTDPLGRPALGVTIPDGSRTLGALEQRARSAAQETDRLDASGDSTGQALAAGSPPHPAHGTQRQRRGSLLVLAGAMGRYWPFGRTILPLDEALHFIAHEDIFWVLCYPAINQKSGKSS